MTLTGVGDSLAQLVASGSFVVAAPIAIAAGLVSFASPCVLPLVPGYLGYVAGLTGGSQHAHTSTGGLTTSDDRARTRRLLLGAIGFVVGFSAVFLALGIVAGHLAVFLQPHMRTVNIVSGALVVVMGLITLGVSAGWVNRIASADTRLSWRPTTGLFGAPLLGAIFGLGWAPCISPVFAAVLALTLTPGATATRGLVLAGCYCIGLGLPFVAAALALGRGLDHSQFLRKHRQTISKAGGVLLIGVGIVLMSGQWNTLVDSVRMFETVI